MRIQITSTEIDRRQLTAEHLAQAVESVRQNGFVILGQVIPGSIYRYRVYAVRPSPLGPQGTGVSNVITVRIPDQDRGRN